MKILKKGGFTGQQQAATNKLTLPFAFNPKYFSDLSKIFPRLDHNIYQIGQNISQNEQKISKYKRWRGYRLPATNHKLTLLFAFNPKHCIYYISDWTKQKSQRLTKEKSGGWECLNNLVKYIPICREIHINFKQILGINAR